MATKTYHHGDLKNALIQAGIEILSEEGLEALSLRKVAQRAGVSHNAPYSHFSDKQSLIAAISTEGFNQLYRELDDAITANLRSPKKQLQQGALAYVRFALENRDTFKIMFSGILEQEKEYPAFVEISQKTFQRVVDVVRACQKVKILPAKPAEMLAVTVWGQLHGIVLLAFEGQIPHTVLDRHMVEEIILFSVDRMLVS